MVTAMVSSFTKRAIRKSIDMIITTIKKITLLIPIK